MTRTASGETPAERAPAGGKYLTFVLDGEEYGLEILKVQEIIGLLKITPVPRTPSYLRGVINLRGRVIPVIDLRAKFGMPAIEATQHTCIIVVHSRGQRVGLMVDRVSEVSDIGDEAVDPAPSLGADVRTEFLLGLGKSEQGVTILLDIDRVLSSDDVVELKRTAGADS